MTDVYGELLALAQREHALVVAGSWEDLAALDAERRACLARMPATPPPAAADVLGRVAAVQAQTNALLQAGVEELRREIGALSHGRTAVRGYAGATPAEQPSRLDLQG